jgi:hypothetical protein
MQRYVPQSPEELSLLWAIAAYFSPDYNYSTYLNRPKTEDQQLVFDVKFLFNMVVPDIYVPLRRGSEAEVQYLTDELWRSLKPRLEMQAAKAALMNYKTDGNERLQATKQWFEANKDRIASLYGLVDTRQRSSRYVAEKLGDMLSAFPGLQAYYSNLQQFEPM